MKQSNEFEKIIEEPKKHNQKVKENNEISAEGMTLRIRTKETAFLPQFDRLLKSFRYRHALDSVLARRSPSLFVSAVRELIRRQGLLVALSGRSDAEVVLLVDMITRSLANPRYANFLIEVAFTLLDIYASNLGESHVLQEAFQSLRNVLSRLVKIDRRLFELEGQLRLIRTANALESSGSALN